MNIRLAPKWGLIDWPKARGVAQDHIPIVGYSLVLMVFSLILVGALFENISGWVVATAGVMGVMGHLDDRRPLPPFDKMFLQLACVSCVVIFDPNISAAFGERYGAWGSFWAAFFILGLVNAINFIDGIDGLAGMVIWVGALGFLLLVPNGSHFDTYRFFTQLTLGAIIPFFYINVVRRKGFMGNVGSYFFGYLLAVAHVSLPLQAADPISRLALSGLCFLIPIADACTVMVTRLVTLRSPFQADKGHLHHRLIQSGVALRYILLSFAAIEMLALSSAVILNHSAVAAASWLPLSVGACLLAVTSLLTLLVDKASKKRVRGYFQQMDALKEIQYLRYQVGTALSPVKPVLLKRLEARISAELRVTDVCFAEPPDHLFITLCIHSEPVQRITARIEAIFISEKIVEFHKVESGVIQKMPSAAVPIRAIA